MIVAMNNEPVIVVRAVNLEKCSLEDNETAARRLQENGRAMLNMALVVQASIVRDFRRVMDHRDQNIWQSFHKLGQYLHQQDVEGVSEEDSTVELWLLRLLGV